MDTSGRQPVTVLRVIDGDSVVCRFGLMLGISVEVHCRLEGIDAPELHAANQAVRAKGWAAKARLTEMVEAAQRIEASGDKQDKYGRLLVKLYMAPGAESMNDRMVSEGHAAPYGGGPRGSYGDNE